MTPAIEEAFRVLVAYLAVEVKGSRADAVYCLGAAGTAPAVKAARLFHDGFAPTIFSLAEGGRFSDPGLTEPECEIFRRELLRLGVPEERVFTDPRCLSTYDEARTALAFMRSCGVDASSVAVVSVPLHQRRAYAAFTHLNPSVEIQSAPADAAPPLDRASLWRIDQEMRRLVDYARTGTLSPQPMSGDILTAWTVVQDIVDTGDSTRQESGLQ